MSSSWAEIYEAVRTVVRADSTIIVVAAMGLMAPSGCAQSMQSTSRRPPPQAELAQLWVDPHDIQSRDLFHGPGGRELAPRADERWAFMSLDGTGYSRGYDVRDREGRIWSAKLGPEAQSEVVASRILWAIGYHQPPTYYLATWTLTYGPGTREVRQQGARFRPELPHQKRISDWAWHRNPFIGTQPFRGLILLNMMILNNWDMKSTNNKIYDLTQPEQGAARWYVVRDLGASLGRHRRFPWGTRNDPDGFEQQRFVRAIENGRVRFHYPGRHGELLRDMTVADVTWTCELLSRLTPEQLDDAFRAGGYDEPVRARFIGRLRAKVHEGLALARRADMRFEFLVVHP